MLDIIRGIRLSSEQMVGVDAAINPDNRVVKIESPAGSGKTLLTEAIIWNFHNMGMKGKGLAFNYGAAKSLRKRGLPSSCAFTTYHGLARSRLSPNNAKRIGHLSPWQVIKVLGLTYFAGGTPLSQAYLILESLDRWGNSSDRLLEPVHVTGESLGVMRERGGANADFIAHIVRKARELWNHVWSPGSILNIPHTFYLKQWARKSGNMGLDYVIVDEAQDLNPVVLGWLRKQRSKIVLIGDSNQQIYAWRGAIDALQAMDFDEEIWLSRSYRFGQPVADVATDIISGGLGSDREIIGNPDVESEVIVGRDDVYDTFIARYNSSLFTKLAEEDCRVRVLGSAGTMKRILEAVIKLQQGKPCAHELLSHFSTWGEVEQFARTKVDGEIGRLVNVVNRHGAGGLLEAFERKVVESGYDLTLATAHGSKGLEFDYLRLADDFPGLKDSRNEEVRLLYVAVTRAKHRLSVPANVKLKSVTPLAGLSGQLTSSPS